MRRGDSSTWGGGRIERETLINETAERKPGKETGECS